MIDAIEFAAAGALILAVGRMLLRWAAIPERERRGNLRIDRPRDIPAFGPEEVEMPAP